MVNSSFCVMCTRLMMGVSFCSHDMTFKNEKSTWRNRPMWLLKLSIFAKSAVSNPLAANNCRHSMHSMRQPSLAVVVRQVSHFAVLSLHARRTQKACAASCWCFPCFNMLVWMQASRGVRGQCWRMVFQRSGKGFG